jgi:magnesium-transporting ATPase (P-type)
VVLIILLNLFFKTHIYEHITGDGPLVTAHVCRRVGVKFDDTQTMSGDDVDALEGNDAELALRSEHCVVFSRLLPQYV